MEDLKYIHERQKKNIKYLVTCKTICFFGASLKEQYHVVLKSFFFEASWIECDINPGMW